MHTENDGAVVNGAYMLDEAPLPLNFATQHASKRTSEKLKKLENVLVDENFLTRYSEIVDILDEINGQDLYNYKNDENGETFLHQIINRPKMFVNEQALADLFFKFVDRGCNINATDSYSWTVLHYCCVYKKNELAKLIIKHPMFDKSLINAQSSKQLKTDTLYYLIGTTPLQICAWLNNLILAKLLVQHGASILDKNEAGWTCLHICSRQAHADFIVYLLERGANVNDGNNHDKTPLHVSSRHGHRSIAELLLKAKANVALVNNYGQSALYVAVTRKHYEVVELLIEYGSDVNQSDKQQNNPLHACALIREATTEKADGGYNKNETSVRIGELLIQKGCSLVRQNYLGRTALHYAAKNNCANFATMLLLHAPIVINIRDIYGQTALYIACKWKSDNVFRLLLNRRANKDISDLSGKTPLHELCAEKGTDSGAHLMSELFKFGDDVNKASIGNVNDTPLHIASRSDNAQVISFLLDNNADVNKVNRDGETPLHISAQSGSYESCLILLDGGAKINKTTKAGLTPLHSSILASKNSVNIASLLIDYGVSINQEDSEKATPLAMSTIRGNFGVVKLLIEKKAKIINSNYESVAHYCAKRNQCDTKCFQLLISTYGFDSLFDYSLANYRTPLQLCVEKKSQEFLKAAISCSNITCSEWFKSLHSTRGLGVSPIVMAVTSQNYMFLTELIKMWLQLFHDEHHTYTQETSEVPTIISFASNMKKMFTKPVEAVAAGERRESVLFRTTDELVKTHGCSRCHYDDVCLFKPNWNDPEQASGKYFLNTLIRENSQLANEILNTFMKTDILKWETYIYLDHFEPCEDILNTNEGLHERPFTPLETIYVHNKTELVTHPVVKALIDEKLKDYAKIALVFDMVRQFGLLILWTAFACIEDYAILHSYDRPNRAGKVVLVILCILFFLWEVIEELMQIAFIVLRLNGHKKWVRGKQNESLNAIGEQLNSHRKSIVASRDLDQKMTQAKFEKEKNKYLLIEKEIRAINTLTSPYKRSDNIFDWLICALQIATLVTHFIDIAQHTDLMARVHIIISAINVILIWLRELLVVNGLIPATNLVCMLRLLGADILRFGFLFIRIYIPFLLLFWVLFSGSKVSENVMQKYYQECEHVNYQVPYKGSYNLTAYQANSLQTPFDCTPQINVNGMEDFYSTMYSVFRFIVIDNYDFDNMKTIQNVLAPIICALFLILSAVIGVNFFIGLMSNVLSEGAYKSVEAHRSMELLGYVLRQEWRLNKSRRQNHLNKIKTECSPKILKNNNVIIEEHTTSSKLVTSAAAESSGDSGSKEQLIERFNKLQEMLENQIGSWRGANEQETPVQRFSSSENSNSTDRVLLVNLKNDVSQLKSDITEIKNLLKSAAKL